MCNTDEIICSTKWRSIVSIMFNSSANILKANESGVGGYLFGKLQQCVVPSLVFFVELPKCFDEVETQSDITKQEADSLHMICKQMLHAKWLTVQHVKLWLNHVSSPMFKNVIYPL